MSETIDIRRATDRFATELGWLKARHSFSFGTHFDPLNVSHGLLIVSNKVLDPEVAVVRPMPPQ
jgi:hypothetical protein